MENFKTKLTRVKAFIFDVDGVLTDGSVILMPDGEQVRTMNIKDGYALEKASQLGYKIAIISGGKQEIIRKRMAGLGVTDVYLGIRDKLDTFKEYIEIHNISPDEILYMGDDMPDYEVMQRVGVPTCPNDSSPEIKAISIYVSPQNGGKGAVRDVIEQVLRVQGKWNP